MRTNPAIDEPSKPLPSLKALASSEAGMVKSICRPRMSGKMSRTNWMSFAGSRRTARTSFSSLVPKALNARWACRLGHVSVSSRSPGRPGWI